MTLRPRDRIVLGVVVLLAAIGTFYMLVLKPEQEKASSLQTAVATQQQALAQAERSFAAGRAAQTSLKANATQWAALKLALPAQSDIPALLRTLERNANAVHVQMQSITLTGASGAGSTTAPTTTPTTTGSTANTSVSGANSVPIQLTFAGGYAALNRLVQRLDTFVVLSGHRVRASGPLMSISKVSLSKAPKLTVQLTVTIYQLDAPPAATGTTGTASAPTPTTGG
jgi:type II secretory pathway pseudopilin PulG